MEPFPADWAYWGGGRVHRPTTTVGLLFISATEAIRRLAVVLYDNTYAPITKTSSLYEIELALKAA